MDKKEVSEIKKQFSKDGAITRICGCYVTHEKEIKSITKKAFHSLPDEETFKYINIFKKSLSGRIGKNLLNLGFSQEEELHGDSQKLLLELKKSKLQDDALLENFYSKVISAYDHGENYYIILIHFVYDIPGKASDNQEMFDASDEVYEAILCCVCPVKLSKEGLCYNPEEHIIENRIRDWIIDAPAHSFLYPAFNDRSTDIHNLLYYSKKADMLQPRFIEDALGCKLELSAPVQKKLFQTLLMESLGNECSFENLSEIYSQLNAITIENKENPPSLSKADVKKLFSCCDLSVEQMEQFEKTYDEFIGYQTELLSSNISETKELFIETANAKLKIKADRSDLITRKIIDGKTYILIEANDNVELNGVPIS